MRSSLGMRKQNHCLIFGMVKKYEKFRMDHFDLHRESNALNSVI